VQGRSVVTLVDGRMEAGDHHVIWDGMDEAGKRMTSGLYFYQLDNGSERQMRKMLMLK